MFSFLFGNLTKTYEKQVSEFETKLNQVATSLVRSTEENLPNGQYDLASLMDAEKCNQFTLFLGSELDSRFKKVEIEELNLAIFAGKRLGSQTQKNSNNMDSNNYRGPQSRYSKKDLCNKVASHYVRIFNLLSAILSAVNPERNMCARRINALYQTAVDDIESGYVKVCESDDTDSKNKLYPEHIYDIPGIKHLLNLYYFYLIQEGDTNNPDEKKKIQVEFAKLAEAFNTIFLPSSVKPIPSIITDTEQKLNQSLNKLQAAAENRRNNKGKNSIDSKIDGLMTLIQQLTEKVNQFKSTNTTGQLTQADLDTFKTTIQTDLSNFKGDFETKLDALQANVDSLLQKTMGKEAVATAAQNVQENTITTALEQTETQPSIETELQQAEAELEVPTPETLKLENEGQPEPSTTENVETLSAEDIDAENKAEGVDEDLDQDFDLGDDDDLFKDLYPEEATPTTPANIESPPQEVDQEITEDTPAPTAEVPATSAPTAEVPATSAPTAEVPATSAPTAEVPATPAPTAEVPAIPAPTAEVPATSAPTAEVPATPAPTASNNKKNVQTGGENNNKNTSNKATENTTTATAITETTSVENGESAEGAETVGVEGVEGVETVGVEGVEGAETVGVEGVEGAETVGVEGVINTANTRNTTNVISSANDDLIAKSAIEKFVKFAEKYTKEYPSDSQYSLNLRPKTIGEIASNYKCSSEPSKVMIKLNDEKYRDFKEVYQKMRNHYLSSTQKLLDMLEESLVEKDKTSEPPEYKLKSITNKELNDIQKKVLQELTFYYTKCQEYYQEAFQKLSDALYPSEPITPSSS